MVERLESAINIIKAKHGFRTNHQVADAAQINYTYFSQMRKGKNPLGIASRLCKAFPEISYEYIVSGEGDVLKDGGGIMKGGDKVVDGLPIKDEAGLSPAPLITEDIATAENLRVSEVAKQRSNIYPSQLIPNYDLMYIMHDSYASPLIEFGDVLFLRKLKEKKSARMGVCHIVDTNMYGLLPGRVSFDENENIEFAPINPQYGTIKLNNDDVFDIFSIVGVLRKNLVTSPFILDNLNSRNELIDKSILQTNEVLNQNKTLIEQIGRIIDINNNQSTSLQNSLEGLIQILKTKQ